MIWTVIVAYNKTDEYGNFTMNTSNNEVSLSWETAQEQVGDEGTVIGIIKGSHEVILQKDISIF